MAEPRERTVFLEVENGRKIKPVIFVKKFFTGKTPDMISLIRALDVVQVSQNAYSQEIRKLFGITSHTARYLYEDMLNSLGLTPLDIAKVMGWSNIKRVQDYSSAIKAEKKLEEIKEELEKLLG